MQEYTFKNRATYGHGHMTLCVSALMCKTKQVADIVLNCFFFMLGKINSEVNFYLWLNEFLQGPGVSYRKDIRVENGTGPLPEITVRLFHVPKKGFTNLQFYDSQKGLLNVCIVELPYIYVSVEIELMAKSHTLRHRPLPCVRAR